MKTGKLLTTQDINQKFLIGELKGNEVWSFEDNCPQTKPSMGTIDESLSISKDKTADTRKGCGKVIQFKRYRTTCGTTRFDKLHLCNDCKAQYVKSLKADVEKQGNVEIHTSTQPALCKCGHTNNAHEWYKYQCLADISLTGKRHIFCKCEKFEVKE